MKNVLREELFDKEIYKIVKYRKDDRSKYITQLNGKSVFLEIYYRSKGCYKGITWWNRLMTNDRMRDMLYREMVFNVGVYSIEKVKYENCPKEVRKAIKEEIELDKHL